MSIITHTNGSHTDTTICDTHKTFLTNGQGCQTIWFRNAAAAWKAFEKDGVKTGRDLFDCAKCACHYSSGNAKQRTVPFYACEKVKAKYAARFE